MAKCTTGFEREAHKTNYRLMPGDVVTFKPPIPEQDARQVARAQVERACIAAANEAIERRELETSYGEKFAGWLKKIIG